MYRDQYMQTQLYMQVYKIYLYIALYVGIPIYVDIAIYVGIPRYVDIAIYVYIQIYIDIAIYVGIPIYVYIPIYVDTGPLTCTIRMAERRPDWI